MYNFGRELIWECKAEIVHNNEVLEHWGQYQDTQALGPGPLILHLLGRNRFLFVGKVQKVNLLSGWAKQANFDM